MSASNDLVAMTDEEFRRVLNEHGVDSLLVQYRELAYALKKSREALIACQEQLKRAEEDAKFQRHARYAYPWL